MTFLLVLFYTFINTIIVSNIVVVRYHTHSVSDYTSHSLPSMQDSTVMSFQRFLVPCGALMFTHLFLVKVIIIMECSTLSKVAANFGFHLFGIATQEGQLYQFSAYMNASYHR